VIRTGKKLVSACCAAIAICLQSLGQPLVGAAQSAETHMSDPEPVILVNSKLPIPEEGNVVYCSTFSLAWSELNRSSGSNVRLEGDPGVVTLLNEFPASVSDLPNGTFVVDAGLFREHIVGHIDEALIKAFPSSHLQCPVREGRPEEALAFALLKHSLPFSEPFLPMQISFGGKTGVRLPAFGLPKEVSTEDFNRLRGQIRVWRYAAPDSFTLLLVPKQDAEEILLARLPRRPTGSLDAILSTVLEQQLPPPAPLAHGEPVAVPVLSVAVRYHFAELEGRKIISGRLVGQSIDKALQWIDFDMNETGATVESGAIIKTLGSLAQSAGRAFLFDGPFVLILRKVGRAPYFVLLITDPQALRAKG